jgi:glycosyltransferase involved in cell wall biosynthesis
MQSVFSFRRERPDVLIVDNVEAAMAGRLIKLLFGIPLVFDFIDDYTLIAGYDSFKVRFHMIRLLESILPSMADGVIVVDEHKRSFCRRIGVPDHKLHLVANGVDTDVFKPRSEAGTLADLWPAGCRNRLLYVSKLSAYYHGERLIEAFKIVHDSVSGAALVLAGQGDLLPALEELSRRLGVEQGVRFAGFLAPEWIPGLMNQADICLFPLPDSSALALYEYMACAKPTVVPDYGTAKMGLAGDILPDDCIFRTENTPEALAAGILELIGNPDRGMAMGQRARDLVVRNHQWPDLAVTYEAALREVCRAT